MAKNIDRADEGSQTDALKPKVGDLVGQLREVIQSLRLTLTAPDIGAKRAQLRAIGKTVASLERTGVPIPDELKRLESDLLSDLSIIDEATDVLSLARSSLKDLLRQTTPPKKSKTKKLRPALKDQGIKRKRRSITRTEQARGVVNTG